jgi:hypothetical protein
VQNKNANEAVLNAIEEFKTVKKKNPIKPKKSSSCLSVHQIAQAPVQLQ